MLRHADRAAPRSGVEPDMPGVETRADTVSRGMEAPRRVELRHATLQAAPTTGSWSHQRETGESNPAQWFWRPRDVPSISLPAEPSVGIGPTATSLPRRCSTPELRRRSGCEGIRTLCLKLAKLALSQSELHTRCGLGHSNHLPLLQPRPVRRQGIEPWASPASGERSSSELAARWSGVSELNGSQELVGLPQGRFANPGCVVPPTGIEPVFPA